MLCTKHGRRDNNFIHIHNGEKLFIKSEVPRYEWKNQQFLLDRVGLRAAIRIPKIYAVFGEPYRLYLIMEFIQTDYIVSVIQRARAISDIVSIEVPLNIGPGPIGGGRIYNNIRIF